MRQPWNATPAGRVGGAVLAAAWGLVVGAMAAAALATAQVLLSPGIEIASSSRVLVRAPMLIFAEGIVWALLGGAMFVFPPAVLAFAFLRPRNTHAAALAVSALLLAPIVLVNFRSRPTATLLLAVPIWLGVRVALRTFARMGRPPTE